MPVYRAPMTGEWEVLKGSVLFFLSPLKANVFEARTPGPAIG